MKVFFRNIHLYLSLAAGIVIAIVCFTGAVLVFEKEIQQLIYPERYRVEAATSEQVSIEKMVAQLQGQVSGASVSSVKIYADPERTVELSYKVAEEKSEEHKAEEANKSGAKIEDKSTREQEHKKEAAGAKNAQPGGAKGGPGGNSQAFVNPYTGQVVGLQIQRSPFFFTMFSLHRWLLAGDTGKLIVGISTSMFLFILITGIVLWWPQNKKMLKQRLNLRWNAGWKRINHDLHIVVGFYTAIFLFAFAFTGLAWSFKWFNDGIYWITGSENVRPEPPVSVFAEGSTPISFDQAYKIAKSQMPQAEYYTISRPNEPEASISVTVMPKDAVHERATNQMFIDKYSGQLLGTLLYQDRNLGQRVRTTFYPVHVGSIGGLPGRIIAFISCLAGFTFPITGVILWLNRLKKNRKKKQSQNKILAQ